MNPPAQRRVTSKNGRAPRRGQPARALPLRAFMLLLALRGALPTAGTCGLDRRWIDGLAELVVGATLLAWRRDHGEPARQDLPDAPQLLWTAASALDDTGRGEANVRLRPAGGEPDWPLTAIRWMSATVAGLARAWLYIRSGRLWSSVIAHAVTNEALCVWVVCLRQGQFW